jgi:hypothetical protein
LLALKYTIGLTADIQTPEDSIDLLEHGQDGYVNEGEAPSNNKTSAPGKNEVEMKDVDK